MCLVFSLCSLLLCSLLPLALLQGLTLALSFRENFRNAFGYPKPRLQMGALQHPLPGLSCPALTLFHKSPSICLAVGWYF